MLPKTGLASGVPTFKIVEVLPSLSLTRGTPAVLELDNHISLVLRTTVNPPVDLDTARGTAVFRATRLFRCTRGFVVFITLGIFS